MIEPDSFWATLFAAIALGIPISAQIAEVLIANLDHESGQEYAAVARGRGLGQVRLFAKHLLKPSSLPVVTVIALTIGELLGGSLITETVFGRTGHRQPGAAFGEHAGPARPAGGRLAGGGGLRVVNLIADLVYPLLDPRVKLLGAPSVVRPPLTKAPSALSKAVTS